MKIACDCHVPKRAIEIVTNYGFEVVYYARHEHDELWFGEAVKCGAEIFISADSDIENMALNSRFSFIRLPQNVGSGQLVEFIIKSLAALKKIEKLYNANPGMVFVRR